MPNVRDFFVREFLENALKEDLGRGDLFALVSDDFNASAHILAKSGGVFSGEIYAQELCKMCGIELSLQTSDGRAFERGQILGILRGSYLKILQIERVLLNTLAHSSGIATHTRKFIDKLQEISESNPNVKLPKLLDTRKTRPLLRELEKYSVRNGGANNHRFGLDDALMLKDTHLAKITHLGKFIESARAKLPWTCKIEVECEDFEACVRAFEAGADIVMCDNMNFDEIQKVAHFRDEKYPHILLEASGNLNLQNLAQFAHCGADALSIGALIHQATWLDLSLKMQG